MVPWSHVSDVPEVLFVCVHNAGRSQMAAGLLDRYANGRVHVRSAGSTPADEINPAVMAAMGEMPPGTKSSMLEDLERGRRLELPWLSGAVVRIGAEVGVDTPTHRLIVTLLKPHVNGRPASAGA